MSLFSGGDTVSEVDYEAPQNQDPIPPAGFITNNPTHPFFYPIHVPNPTYRETNNTWTGTRTIVAPFIRYSPDFTTVYGSAGIGHQEESLPVHLLKKVQDPHHLSYDDWKQLQGGSQGEFVINMAMNEINNPCLTGEVNRYRKEIKATRALRDLEAETHARQHKISQEREVVEKTLRESMWRIEQARAYEELTHHIRMATSPPLSPHATPFIPCRNGPAEMPILTGEEDPTQRQVASRSPKIRRNKRCSKCGSRKHRSKQCSLGLAPITSTLGQERMMLTERLALMDKPDWAPALCKKCFRHNPGHMELDYPQYEQCQRCYSWGPRGSVRCHACRVQAEEDEDMDYDVDTDIYQGRE